MPTLIKLRSGTADAWVAANPVLKKGEPGLEEDTGQQKIGDGVRTWTQLPYATIPASQRGVPGGVATLGPAGKLVSEQMPLQALTGSRLMTSTTPSGVTVTVSFAQPFATPPTVTTSIDSRAPTSVVRVAGVDQVTTTGFRLFFARSDTTSTTVNWVAIGQAAGSAPAAVGIALSPWYAGGAKPDGDLLSLQRVARRRYDAFMSYCLTQTGMPVGMPAGAYRIQSPNQGFHPSFVLGATVSEGMGYGMLLNAWMSNPNLPSDVRVNGQAIFDGLWTYYRHYRDANGLMNWHIGPDGVVQNTGGASDGDFDVAMALIVAHRMWGSGGTVNYGAEATALIRAIRDFEFTPVTYTGVGGANVMMNGDLWGVDTDRYMPDYFRPAWFREFQRHTGDARWGDIIAKNYPIALGHFFKNFTGGVVPDGCTRAGLNNGAEAYTAGYNAVRLGFGIASDYLWNPTTANTLSPDMMNRMIGRAKALWPLGGDTKAPVYDLNLTASATFGNGAGWGMFGPASLVASTHSKYAAEIMARIDADTEKSYFNNGLSAMAAMFMAGISQPGS